MRKRHDDPRLPSRVELDARTTTSGRPLWFRKMDTNPIPLLLGQSSPRHGSPPLFLGDASLYDTSTFRFLNDFQQCYSNVIPLIISWLHVRRLCEMRDRAFLATSKWLGTPSSGLIICPTWVVMIFQHFCWG
jgi:hypothetical protein